MEIRMTENKIADQIVVDYDYVIDGYATGRIRHVSDKNFKRIKTIILLEGDVVRYGCTSVRRAHNCMMRLLKKKTQ